MSAQHLALWALAGVAIAAVLALDRWDRGRKNPKAARWASRRDLAALRVKAPTRGRVTLGRFSGALIAAEDRASTCVMGPTQLAGKSSRVVIPAILEWDGPVLTTSIKPDTLNATLAHRAAIGQVKIFDPLDRAGYGNTATWSPIAAASTWSEAREVAAHLMQVGWEQAKQDKDPHWRPAAARVLAPMLLAANQARLSLEDVGVWIDQGDRDQAEKILKRSSDPSVGRALDVLRSLGLKDDRYASSVLATLEEGLDPWQEPGIVSATSEEDITAEWLLSGSNTLYVIGAGQDQRRLASLFGALLMRVVDDALAIASTRPAGRLDPPLLCALDEVANIAPIPALGRYASAGLGPGVLLLTVLQDYSQALEHWGAERAQSILANHTAKLFASGIGDPGTLRYIAELLGNERVEQRSTHRGRQRSTTTGEHLEPLAPPHRVRQAAADTALLVYGRYAPAWIELRPYFKDRKLRALAEREIIHRHYDPSAPRRPHKTRS